MAIAQLFKTDNPESREMLTTTETLSPERAQALLDTMPQQRRMRKSKLNQLRRIVNQGRWKLLPHGIVIDWNGCLRDGQHRLTVCTQTNKPMVVRVTTNVDPELYLEIDDTQTPKTLEDMLKYEGCSAGLTTILGEPVRMLYRQELGSSPLETTCRPTNSEGRDVFLRHPKLLIAGELACRCRLAPARSLLAFTLYKGVIADETMTRLFVDQCARGENLRGGDPALLLRNSWIEDRAHRIERTRGDQIIMAATALKDAIGGKKRSSWRGVEFGKGKLPAFVTD